MDKFLYWIWSSESDMNWCIQGKLTHPVQNTSESNSEKASQKAIQHRKGVAAGASIHMKISDLIHRSQYNWGTPVLQYQASKSVLHHSSMEQCWDLGIYSHKAGRQGKAALDLVPAWPPCLILSSLWTNIYYSNSKQMSLCKVQRWHANYKHM